MAILNNQMVYITYSSPIMIGLVDIYGRYIELV